MESKPQQSTGTPYRDMICILTFGMAFPNVMSD